MQPLGPRGSGKRCAGPRRRPSRRRPPAARMASHHALSAARRGRSPPVRGRGQPPWPVRARPRRAAPSEPCSRCTRALPRAAARRPRRGRRGALQPRRRHPQGLRILGGAGRMRAHALEQVLELGADGLRVAEGDARRDERDELAVGGVRVAVHDADGIGLPARRDVAAGAHGVEACSSPASVADRCRPVRARRGAPEASPRASRPRLVRRATRSSRTRAMANHGSCPPGGRRARDVLAERALRRGPERSRVARVLRLARLGGRAEREVPQALPVGHEEHVRVLRDEVRAGPFRRDRRATAFAAVVERPPGVAASDRARRRRPRARARRWNRRSVVFGSSPQRRSTSRKVASASSTRPRRIWASPMFIIAVARTRSSTRRGMYRCQVSSSSWGRFELGVRVDERLERAGDGAVVRCAAGAAASRRSQDVDDLLLQVVAPLPGRRAPSRRCRDRSAGARRGCERRPPPRASRSAASSRSSSSNAGRRSRRSAGAGAARRARGGPSDRAPPGPWRRPTRTAASRRAPRPSAPRTRRTRQARHAHRAAQTCRAAANRELIGVIASCARRRGRAREPSAARWARACASHGRTGAAASAARYCSQASRAPATSLGSSARPASAGASAGATDEELLRARRLRAQRADLPARDPREARAPRPRRRGGRARGQAPGPRTPSASSCASRSASRSAATASSSPAVPAAIVTRPASTAAAARSTVESAAVRGRSAR